MKETKEATETTETTDNVIASPTRGSRSDETNFAEVKCTGKGVPAVTQPITTVHVLTAKRTSQSGNCVNQRQISKPNQSTN
jgi:hypothetical protein